MSENHFNDEGNDEEDAEHQPPPQAGIEHQEIRPNVGNATAVGAGTVSEPSSTSSSSSQALHLLLSNNQALNQNASSLPLDTRVGSSNGQDQTVVENSWNRVLGNRQSEAMEGNGDNLLGNVSIVGNNNGQHYNQTNWMRDANARYYQEYLNRGGRVNPGGSIGMGNYGVGLDGNPYPDSGG
jgi:hypothetical protein